MPLLDVGETSNSIAVRRRNFSFSSFAPPPMPMLTRVFAGLFCHLRRRPHQNDVHFGCGHFSKHEANPASKASSRLSSSFFPRGSTNSATILPRFVYLLSFCLSLLLPLSRFPYYPLYWSWTHLPIAMLRSVLRNRFVASFGNGYTRNARQHFSYRLASSESKPDNPESPQQANNTSARPDSDEQSLLSELEKLGKQLDEKDAEIADLNDKTLRILAEMENVRMIARRDVDNAKIYAIAPFAKALLSVADNLGLALQAVPPSALNSEDSDPQLKGLFTGIAATEAELLKVFSQHGIQRFGEIGDNFDPNKYQAMFEAPSADHEPGAVMNVTKLGYTIGDRVLRPAEVGVSKLP